MLDEKILSALRNRPANYISGEELSKDAGISRSAVWKRIGKLREEGYEIEASPHLGYRLIHLPDSLIPSEIQWKLRTRLLGKEIISYKCVDSTNDAAYSLAEKGLKEGAVIFSEEQAKGKGRHGRNWISPPRTGIYMSCVLRPDIAPNEISRITLLAAVSVAEAIHDVTGLSAMIKWPNDILVNDRKVCGILTEMKAEQDRVDFVILGIGVNVNTSGERLPKAGSSLEEEIRKIGRPACLQEDAGQAGRDEQVSRIELAKKILEYLECNYSALKIKGFDPIIEAWKGLSEMIGARVKVIMQNRTFEGQAHDIDMDGSLLVRREHGLLEKVSSGDVVIVR